MTCREKLKREHPERVGDKFIGGCESHPSTYGYLSDPGDCLCDEQVCRACWDREIPEVAPTNAPIVPNDNVNHPSHYETGKVECIDAMIETQGKEAVQAFCICNSFKYLWRHKHKNQLEDVKKAIWYLNKFVELEESK